MNVFNHLWVGVQQSGTPQGVRLCKGRGQHEAYQVELQSSPGTGLDVYWYKKPLRSGVTGAGLHGMRACTPGLLLTLMVAPPCSLS